MPELPDLVYIEKILKLPIIGRKSRFQLQEPGTKRIGNICFTLHPDNGLALHYGDNKKRARSIRLKRTIMSKSRDILSRESIF